MDAMMAALKAKRGQSQGPAMPDQQMPQMNMKQQGSGMKELAMQLSPEQKDELMGLLAQDQSDNGDTSAIDKGGVGSGEKAEIEEKMAGQSPDMDDASDDVQMGMLDRNSLQKAEAGAKPRGLGDRAKMAAASKLKSKGKLK